MGIVWYDHLPSGTIRWKVWNPRPRFPVLRSSYTLDFLLISLHTRLNLIISFSSIVSIHKLSITLIYLKKKTSSSIWLSSWRSNNISIWLIPKVSYPPYNIHIPHPAHSASIIPTNLTDSLTGSQIRLPYRSGEDHVKPHENRLFPNGWTRALDGNKAWVASLPTTHPGLLEENAERQTPEILWIGCSDSRVPETTITDRLPGDIFVHRNIANILHPGDINTTAVITYAVNVLLVKHIVVCGHMKCGGVEAALDNKSVGGVLDSWLLPLRTLREALSEDPTWAALSPEKKKVKLVEENIRAGVRTIRRNADVIRAGARLNPLHPITSLQVHGAVYDVATGLVTELHVPEDAAERNRRLEAFAT